MRYAVWPRVAHGARDRQMVYTGGQSTEYTRRERASRGRNSLEWRGQSRL